MRFAALFPNYIFMLCMAVPTGAALGQDAQPDSQADESGGTKSELMEKFDARLNLITFAQGFDPEEESVLNPGNIFSIFDRRYSIQLRPDFSFTGDRLELDFKPRLHLDRTEWSTGPRAGESESDEDLFVNEWMARLRLGSSFFVSYGRENFQWGPSLILSASNPFNPRNGQTNTKIELPGLDYAKAIWVPSSAWSASLIVNTDDGRLGETNPLPADESFEEIYAAKIDYTGTAFNLSLIPSTGDEQPTRLGWYGSWNASDALLLHMEGSFASGSAETRVTAGASYTWNFGGTIRFEYLDQDGICTLENFSTCFTSPDVVEEIGEFSRSQYALLQYDQTRIGNKLNLSIRGIRGFDDDSSRINAIIEFEASDHIQLFFVGNTFTGGRDSEYGSLLNYTAMLGLSYTH